MADLAATVRQRPLASSAVGSGCYSLGYSVAWGSTPPSTTPWARWASDELRSTSAQIEFLLRRALADACRLPSRTGPMRPRGRPPAAPGPARHRTAMTSLGDVMAWMRAGASALQHRPPGLGRRWARSRWRLL